LPTQGLTRPFGKTACGVHDIRSGRDGDGRKLFRWERTKSGLDWDFIAQLDWESIRHLSWKWQEFGKNKNTSFTRDMPFYLFALMPVCLSYSNPCYASILFLFWINIIAGREGERDPAMFSVVFEGVWLWKI
jgi:hypothetical protein